MIGRTLGFYLAGHFLRNVLFTFALFFALITAVDLIDQTRRAARVESGSFPEFLAISASRAAVLAENIWPFAALFGSMATLVVLNRRLELVVARAAGVSAWRFLLPAVASAAILGLASAALYNPLVRWAEDAGKRLEAEIYGDEDTQGYTRNFWLRTNGGNGAQVIYARVSEDRGRLLTGVSRYLFQADGASAGSFLSPIKSAVGSIGGILGMVFAALIVLLTLAIPVGLVVFAGSRLRRWFAARDAEQLAT